MEVVFKSQSFCPRNARFILLPRLKDRSVLLLLLAESVGSVGAVESESVGAVESESADALSNI